MQRMMSTQIDTIVNAYKTLSKIPSVVSGKLSKNATRITSKWSIRNIDKGKNTKYSYSYMLNDNLDVIAESDFGTDISNELLSAVSPKETYKAVIREEKEGKDSKKQYLEVWQANRLAHSVDLTGLDLHGDVYADSEFGSLDWADDEKSILYVAEKKHKKSEPYIKRKPAEDVSKTDGSGEKVVKKGEEFVYRQDWGEQLVGKHMSVLVLCQLETESFRVLEGLPDSWCPGQARFLPGGRGVVGVAWETEPRRLGLICTNRPSCVFTLTLAGELTRLSGASLTVRAPRPAPGGALCWLQRAAAGPHHACLALHRLPAAAPPPAAGSAPVVDIVQTETRTADGGAFHGLYCQGLPGRCFSEDGRLVLSTPQQNEIRSYVLDVETKRLVDISIKSSPGSTTVLDVHSDVILAVFSNMTTPSQLYVARLPAAGREAGVQWRRVGGAGGAPTRLAACAVDYLQLRHDDGSDDVNSFSAIYMAPDVAGDKKIPLVVWPHGGPHSSFVNAFSLEAALFNMLGFACLQVNYRGSTGAGQASVDFLLKRIGDADVKDCKLATDEALKRYPAIDKERVVLTGGSHGGFLVLHLSGQYPDAYAAVVSRNPVTDVASMYNSTDIPDWCAVEAGFEFDERAPMPEEQLLAMRRRSPVARAHRVRAPTALMLGAADRRVPHHQGLEFARRLRANGVPTRIYMYEDNHSLSSLPAEMDNLINGASWMLEHLKL